MVIKDFNKEDLFSINNQKKAEEYINKKGFFGNSIEELYEEVQQNSCFFLKKIINAERPFIYERKHLIDGASLFFLPCEKVKEEKENLKPIKSVLELEHFITMHTTKEEPVLKIVNKNGQELNTIRLCKKNAEIFESYGKLFNIYDYKKINGEICLIGNFYEDDISSEKKYDYIVITLKRLEREYFLYSELEHKKIIFAI